MLRTLIIGIIVGIMTLPVFARVIEVEGSARIVGGDTPASVDDDRKYDSFESTGC